MLLGALGYAFSDAWEEAKPRLRHVADLVDLGIALVILAAYYLLFTIAWQRILRAWGLHIPYFLALQAEMASILLSTSRGRSGSRRRGSQRCGASASGTRP